MTAIVVLHARPKSSEKVVRVFVDADRQRLILDHSVASRDPDAPSSRTEARLPDPDGPWRLLAFRGGSVLEVFASERSHSPHGATSHQGGLATRAWFPRAATPDSLGHVAALDPTYRRRRTLTPTGADAVHTGGRLADRRRAAGPFCSSRDKKPLLK
jgi:hypothetical protein